MTLANGVRMPKIGFGCAFGNWTDKGAAFYGFQPELGWRLVPAALGAGYRMLDCALVYGSHQVVGISVGQALASGALADRSSVFIQSKVFHPPGAIILNRLENSVDMAAYLADPSLDVKARILHDVERCLAELNVGYLDSLLLHWPGLHDTTDEAAGRRLRRQAWAALEEAHAAGRVRAIGVSNFLVRHLEALLEDCAVPPMLNQLEVNPYMAQAETVRYCQSKGIVVQAWGPFGSGATGVLQDPVLAGIAARLGKNVGQVILLWLLQQGMAALPKSASPARMAGNLDVFDFALSDEDMQAISALDRGITSVTTADSIA